MVLFLLVGVAVAQSAGSERLVPQGVPGAVAYVKVTHEETYTPEGKSPVEVRRIAVRRLAVEPNGSDPSVLRITTRSDLGAAMAPTSDASLGSVVDAASWAVRDTAAGAGMVLPVPVLSSSRASGDLGARLDLSPFDAVTDAVGKGTVGSTVSVAWAGALRLEPRRRDVASSRPAFRAPSGVTSGVGTFAATMTHDAADGLPSAGRAEAELAVVTPTGTVRVLLRATFERVPFPQPMIPGLVEVGEGTLPLVISAPHGGRTKVPDTPERTGQGVDRFVTVLDGNTYEVARGVVDGLQEKLGGKPWWVLAKAARKFADVNRAADNAYESDGGRAFFEAYHDAVWTATRAVKNAWGTGMMFDIHGQGTRADTIFRGTAHRTTMGRAIDVFGKDAVVGDKSAMGVLAGRGRRVFPANADWETPEHASYTGGYITRTYGGRDRGFDTMQFELGNDYRKAEGRSAAVKDLVDAIASQREHFLPKARR